MAIEPSAFQGCSERWIASLLAQPVDSSEQLTDRSTEILAIDGKALRGSHHHRAGLGPLFLVSAWAVQRGISLGQLATAEKSNEISVIPELLKQIDVTGAVVTIDAAGCQKDIATRIIECQGDYVLALNGNQRGLHEAVREQIIDQLDDDREISSARTHVEQWKGHGLVNEITYCQLPMPANLPASHQWTGLKTIGVVIRRSQSAKGETEEVRYFISSLPLGVKQFAACVGGHWGIENSLYWCLDVTFREDECRVRNRILGDNLAWLRRFAISLLKQIPDKLSIAMRRQMAGWDSNYLAKLLGIPA
jgi:predicted transposase YbfD/YdcC